MTVMFGDAQCMCWTRLLVMERKSQSGSCDLSEWSTWGTCQSIPAQCHLSWILRLAPSPHSFMSYLMIGLPQLQQVRVRQSARNALKQACFWYDGTQGGRYAAQATGAPYAELDKKLQSDMKEMKEAMLIQWFVNMVYCHLGFTAPTI
jgi:hypothetical protein